MLEPKVLIVIPSYNGVAFFKDCLESLSRMDYPEDRYDVLIIDDRSTDDSVSYLKDNWPKCQLIVNEKNLGFAGNINVGLRLAIERNFEYAYLLNQDTVVEPDFLQEAVKLAQSDEKIGAVQSKLLLYDTKEINSWGNEIHYLGLAYAGGYRQPDVNIKDKEIAYPSGAAALIKVSALKYAGLLNEEFFMYHEDTDLGWRLWLCGYRVMLSAKSVVYHKYEFSRSISKYYFMERNRFLIIWQNYRIRTLILLTPALIAFDVAMFLYSFYAGWWRQELKVYSYLSKPKKTKIMIQTRFSVQSLRQVKDKEIIKRFTGRIEFQDFQNPLLTYIINPLFNAYWQVVKRLIWW